MAKPEVLPYATPEASNERQPVLGVFLMLMGIGFGLFGVAVFVIGLATIIDSFASQSSDKTIKLLFMVVMVVFFGSASAYVCIHLCRAARAVMEGRKP